MCIPIASQNWQTSCVLRERPNSPSVRWPRRNLLILKSFSHIIYLRRISQYNNLTLSQEALPKIRTNVIYSVDPKVSDRDTFSVDKIVVCFVWRVIYEWRHLLHCILGIMLTNAIAVIRRYLLYVFLLFS